MFPTVLLRLFVDEGIPIVDSGRLVCDECISRRCVHVSPVQWFPAGRFVLNQGGRQ